MALIVTRKPGEAIYVGDDVKISIGHENEYGQIPLIIKAPKSIIIDRAEIREKPNYTARKPR